MQNIETPRQESRLTHEIKAILSDLKTAIISLFQTTDFEKKVQAGVEEARKFSKQPVIKTSDNEIKE